MAYTKINWINDDTELSAENFDYMEDGILNSYNVSLLAVSETAPSECSTGDKYYNTSTKKIYTATSEDTWGTTGEDPISDILYVVFSEKNTYSYDGTDLVSVGGGSGSEIVVEPDEPTEDTKLIFEEMDLDAQYTESEYYSTEEVKTNKVWIDGKPIYRKTFNNVTGPGTTDGIIIDAPVSNINTLLDIYGTFKSGQNVWKINTYYSSAFNISLYYNQANNQIRGIAGQSSLNSVGNVTMEYTKTTDQATRSMETRNLEIPVEEPIDEGDER